MRLFIYEFISAGGLPHAAPSLRREGWAMLAAVAADFGRVDGIEVWTLLQEGTLPDLGHVCERCLPAEEESRFRTLAAQADATLVIAPEFERILLKRSRWVWGAGRRLLGSLPAAVRLTGDKWALAKHWQSHGVATPRTAPMVPHGLPLPVICKPRCGAGSQETYLVRQAGDWPKVSAEAWPQGMVMQPYAEGLPASVAFLVGPAQTMAFCPARQLLSDDGRFQYLGGELPLPPPLAGRAARLARAALADIKGLGGYVGVDLVLGAEESDDRAIEINPRLTTSYLGLRRLCRGNLAEAWLRIVQGERVPDLAWGSETVRFTVAQ
jgi:predicted ATP-grasp superfamily ATP-dependent carboligase